MEYLRTATGGAETNAPLTVRLALNISEQWDAVNTVTLERRKYVILDLSVCTATGNTITGTKTISSGNDFNIIWYNRYIKGIILPATLTGIGDYAFYSCYSLTSVTIPSGVTVIGNSAFYGCSGLTSVIFDTGSNIASDSFGSSAFPQVGGGGDSLKTAYNSASVKSGTYRRFATGSVWTKQN